MASITVKGIPDGLYERVRQRAEANRRSINSEIIVCLEQSTGGWGTDADPEHVAARSVGDPAAAIGLIGDGGSAASGEGRRLLAVGVRDLQRRMSEYLRLVASGTVILVTDRDEVLAELRRPALEEEPTSRSSLRRRRNSAVVLRARPRAPSDLYRIHGRPAMPSGLVLDLLDGERGER